MCAPRRWADPASVRWQFIIISLRNNMFELADRLVGIYKTNNATKSVAINPVRRRARLELATRRCGLSTAGTFPQASFMLEGPPPAAAKPKAKTVAERAAPRGALVDVN